MVAPSHMPIIVAISRSLEAKAAILLFLVENPPVERAVMAWLAASNHDMPP